MRITIKFDSEKAVYGNCVIQSYSAGWGLMPQFKAHDNLNVLNAVWLACIEFITWYNQQSK